MMRGPTRSMVMVLILALFTAFPYAAQGQDVETLLDEEPEIDISLMIAVPLTKDDVNTPEPGWLQLASALMAIEHFNSRNATVVPQLATMDPSCRNIRFGQNATKVLDTGTNAHVSMKDFATNTPDAIVGPFNEIPAFEISVFATSLQIPVVSHTKAADPSLLNPHKHPYFSQISADPYAEMEFVGSFLNHTGRTNYIAIVYSSTPSIMQKVDILRAILDQGAVHRQVRTFGYHSINTTEGPHDDSIRYALARVHDTGFRTIVVLSGDLESEANELQEAADIFELNRGGHFWVMSGGAAELSFSEQLELLRISNETHGNRSIFTGAAYLTSCDGFDFDFINPFQSSLLQQDKSFMERFDAMIPISNYFDWSYAAESEHILETVLGDMHSWWAGTSYLYDAVMSVGMGACEALSGVNASFETSGDMLLRGIRSVDFTGASGRIVFKDIKHGTRDGKNIRMSVTNLLPKRNDSLLLMTTEVMDPAADEFIQMEPFVYADGSHEPPTLLRDTPEQNYIDDEIRGIGLGLMAAALLVVFSCAIWVFRHRGHSVVIAAQPVYLYALCLGCAVLSLNIYFISPDEGQQWSVEMLDKSCVAAVWVNAIGMMLVYGAIFVKHWRVNRLMQHKMNNKLSFGLMSAPLLFFVSLVVVIQAIWSDTGYYGWEREEIDAITGESIGQCTGNVGYCLFFTGVFLFVPVALAGAFAYKTLGVDDLYSESRWVLIFILVQFQVYLVGAPVVVILDKESSNGRFIGNALLVWTVPMTTMGLIIFPKIWLVRRMQQLANAEGDDASAGGRSNNSRETAANSSGSSATPAEVAESGGTPSADNSTLQLSGPQIQVVTFD